MLIDLLLVFILIGYLIRGWRRGFKYHFVRLLISLVSAFLASLLAKPLSETTILFLQKQKIMVTIEASAKELLRWFFSVDGGAPQALLKDIVRSQESLAPFVKAAPGTLGPEAQELALTVLSEKLFHFLAYLLAFFLIYSLIRLVILIFVRLLTGVFAKLPGKQLFARFFGLVAGLLNYFLLLNFILFFALALIGVYPQLARLIDRSLILGLMWRLPYIQKLFKAF